MKKIIPFLAVVILIFAAFSLVGAQSKMYVTLGRYEQDNNVSNGPEEIEWLVLATNMTSTNNNDKWALLVSKYAIDARPYNDTRTDVTWETCSLRKWLNGDFYNNAFSQSEKEQIGKFTISNTDNPEYNTPGGNKTSDKVFLLSFDEVIKYFPEGSSRGCEATAYTKAKGIDKGIAIDKKTGMVTWATRTPGSKSWGIVNVDYDHLESFYLNGGAVNGIDGIRPALYIKWNH